MEASASPAPEGASPTAKPLTGRGVLLILLKEGLRGALRALAVAFATAKRIVGVLLQNRQLLLDPLQRLPGLLGAAIRALLSNKLARLLTAAVASIICLSLHYRRSGGRNVQLSSSISLLFGLIKLRGSVALELGTPSGGDDGAPVPPAAAAAAAAAAAGSQGEELRINCSQGLKDHIVRFLDAQAQLDPSAIPTWQITPRPLRPGAPDPHPHPHLLQHTLTFGPAAATAPADASTPTLAGTVSTSSAGVAASAASSGGGKATDLGALALAATPASPSPVGCGWELPAVGLGVVSNGGGVAVATVAATATAAAGLPGAHAAAAAAVLPSGGSGVLPLIEALLPSAHAAVPGYPPSAEGADGAEEDDTAGASRGGRREEDSADGASLPITDASEAAAASLLPSSPHHPAVSAPLGEPLLQDRAEFASLLARAATYTPDAASTTTSMVPQVVAASQAAPAPGSSHSGAAARAGGKGRSGSRAKGGQDGGAPAKIRSPDSILGLRGMGLEGWQQNSREWERMHEE